MIIEIPREPERFGANIFYNVQKVSELDSGSKFDKKLTGLPEDTPFHRFTYEELYEIEKNMAIVVPVCDEELKLLEGVLFAIPHHCLTIVISGSQREPVDRFIMEERLVRNLTKTTKKPIIIVHQKDPILNSSFKQVDYSEILDKNGEVKSGKAEGMIISIILARLANKKYIGFIDSDNYFPGAVYEYIKEYAGGFAQRESDYSMVRIAWYSKPKIVKSNLFFSKQGRVSEISNKYLNQIISYYTGFETDIIKTGNAGEHAMTMELAMILNYSSGYSIEPYHFINLMEKFGGLKQAPFSKVMKQYIEVYQINSRNPHFHREKGNEHIKEMIKDALKVMYHSFVCPEPIKDEILNVARRRKIVERNQGLEKSSHYPPLSKLDLETFREKLEKKFHGITY